MSKTKTKTKTAVPVRAPKKRKSWGRRVFLTATALLALGTVAAAVVLGLGYQYFATDLPTTEALQTYQPPTVTEVYDHKGVLMGEIYEQRRYVLPLDEIPEHMQNAFIAAEDAGFWNHAGIDYIGLVRAVLNELMGGEKSQGASTITMQVTRNFLLTRRKTYERKIREIILAQRLEQTYSKHHILYLYLNEIYLGSGAYGVEAAARVYFGKHVSDITIAEAALMPGSHLRHPITHRIETGMQRKQDRRMYWVECCRMV